jgi:histidine triad (HIT) family protein
VVYSADGITAFRDIHPQAKVHILVIPNEHYVSLNDVLTVEPDLPGRLVQAAAEIARTLGISDSGYRVATNTGSDARQSVGHLHFHLLGGERLSPRLA